MKPGEDIQVKEVIEGQAHNTDLPSATLPSEDSQTLEDAERERIEVFAKQHPFRLDTKNERLFPGKYLSR
jgi:hypothetical protein